MSVISGGTALNRDVARRLQIREEGGPFLIRQRTRPGWVDVVASLGARQSKSFADRDRAFGGRVDFRIPYAISPIVPVIVDWKIGSDAEFTNHRHGVFLWNAEPHAHCLGPFRYLHFEFISYLE